jgi:hypothetical protein
MENRISTVQKTAGIALMVFGVAIFSLIFFSSNEPAYTILEIHYLIWVGVSQLVAGILLLIASRY